VESVAYPVFSVRPELGSWVTTPETSYLRYATLRYATYLDSSLGTPSLAPDPGEKHLSSIMAMNNPDQGCCRVDVQDITSHHV
jgi:hypothetical protein